MIYQIIQIYRANMLLCARLLRTVGSLVKVVDAVCGISHTCGTGNCAVLELRHNTTHVLREVIDENRYRNNTREKNNKKKNNYRVAEHECSKAAFNINSVQFNSCSLTCWLKASTNAFKIITNMKVRNIDFGQPSQPLDSCNITHPRHIGCSRLQPQIIE